MNDIIFENKGSTAIMVLFLEFKIMLSRELLERSVSE